MSWAFILLLLVIIIAAMLLVARFPRPLWTMLGAALLFGLAGYAWQGSPSQKGAPRDAAAARPAFDEDMAKLRNSFGGQYGETGQWLTLSDGLARQGKTKESVNVLISALRAQPNDAALWVAMGNALRLHGDGLLSPSADYSYRQAMKLAPEGSAAPFFYGLALAEAGEYGAARKIWAQLLARLPEQAPLHRELTANIAKLDILMGNRPASAAPAATAPRQAEGAVAGQ